MLRDLLEIAKEHCSKPGLPSREDLVIVGNALSQVCFLYVLYVFLLVINSNLGPISHRLATVARNDH